MFDVSFDLGLRGRQVVTAGEQCEQAVPTNIRKNGVGVQFWGDILKFASLNFVTVGTFNTSNAIRRV